MDKIPFPPEGTDLKNAKLVRVAGMITSVKKLTTKEEKKAYATFKIEDLYGNLECVMFPKTYKLLGDILLEKNVVVVKGKLLNNKGFVKIAVEEIYSVEEAKKKYLPFSGTLYVQVSEVALDDELSEKIINIISKYPGKSKVYLNVKDYQTGDYSIETGYTVKCSDECIKELDGLLGEGAAALQYSDEI